MWTTTLWIQSNAIAWIAKNSMQVNPDKFHFMLSSATPPEQRVLQLCDGAYLMSETEVTVLGVTFDERLYFFAAYQLLLYECPGTYS